MSRLEKTVLEQTKKFRAMLPTLLRQHAGLWVMFRDDAVVSTYKTEDEAFIAAIAAFGPTGGFVVAQVVKPASTPLNAATAFGLARA
jgi:hypothetical protein